MFFPDILYRLTAAGTPLFPEFAAMIKPTEFAPGKRFGSGTMTPVDYMVALADGKVAPPARLNIRQLQQVAESNSFRFHFVQYAHAAGRRLEGPWLRGDPGGLSDLERAVEVLGRRSAGGFQELGGRRGHDEPAR